MKVKNIAIVSLSSGILGEPSVRHELDIGLQRLRDLSLSVRFMPHALKGLDFVREHPEKRAEDLLQAFRDPEIDMILCAIGGDDTYRLLPWLFDHDDLHDINQKIFLGFSDTTVNHFMLHKLGLRTFYGQSFLADICELSPEMLSYSYYYFRELIQTGSIREIRPSPVWYRERTGFDPSQIGVPLQPCPDHGFDLLQGPPEFSGEVLGGCIDTMYDFFNTERYADMPMLCRKYNLFPSEQDWQGKILLLESSEEKMPPEKYRRALEYLRDAGVFRAVSGILVGKPIDNIYAQEYRQLLLDTVNRPDLPIVTNLNIGHAQPRCIIPFGIEAHVDLSHQIIRFSEQD